MSPTSYQTAPPREIILPQGFGADSLSFQSAGCQQTVNKIREKTLRIPSRDLPTDVQRRPLLLWRLLNIAENYTLKFCLGSLVIETHNVRVT
jgi:hypothetical protein